ncbi:hypothetical protein I6N96_02295 [Enterococcus sp. BWM-S5]|uniref:Phage tail tape measure protein n=1 Tax=Enterococcus larvae TaxID=2794352 RepID=A0ABS4CEN7_9ENTE|nr:hypothetical protein [Enterococcus larvae]MBP1045093.1 hypothetical protein [Enterococcus larvae]
MAVEKISIDIDSNSKEVQKELSKVNTQLKKLQKQLPGIQKNVEKLKQAEKSVKAINNQLKKLSTQKAKLQTDTSQLDYTAKKISNVTLQMNRLQARKVKLLVSIDQLLHAEAVLIKLNRELDYLNGRKAVLHIEMDGVQQAISEIDRLSEKMQQLGALQSISLPSIKGEISMNIQTKMDFDMSVLTSKVEELKSLKEISISIQTASKHIEKIEKNVPSNLDSMLSKLLAMGAAIVGMGLLVGIAGALVVTFPLAALAGFATIKLIGVLLEETAKTMELIDAKVPSDFGSMVSKLASMGIALLGMGALVALAGGLSAKFSDQATAGLEMIKEIIGLLGETAEAMEVINEKVPSDLGSMVSKLASMGIAILGMGALVVIADLVATEFKGAKAGIELISEITDLLGKAAEAMGEISSKISSDLGSMVSKLASMGIAILGMGALVVIADVAATKFKGAKAGLELISEITTLLGKAADAMGKIDKKVPSGFGSMIDKLGNMGIAILGMGALVVIAGAVATKFKGTKTGLELISGITDLLGKAADALGQIDKKVPRDIGKVAEKLGSIGVAIGGMSVLVGVVGALTSSGIGALIAGAGLATVYAVAEELIHTSEAIAQLDKNVPEDIDGVKTKIENIAKAIGYFTQSSLASAFDLFKSAMGTINTAVAAEGILKLIEVGQELKKFDEITIPDDIEAKINDIQQVFDYLQKGAGSVGEFIKTVTGQKIDTTTGGDAAEAIKSLASVAESVKELEKIEIKDPDGLQEKIEVLQSTFSYLSKTKGIFGDAWTWAFGGDIDGDKANDAKNYVESLANIAENLKKIEKTTLNYPDVTTKLQNIEDVIKEFEKLDISIDLNGTTLQDAVNKADLLSQLVGHLETALGFTFDETTVSQFETTMDSIKDAIKKIMSTDFTPKEADGTRSVMPDWTWTMEHDIQQAIDKLEKVNEMGTQLDNALKFPFDETSFSTFEDRVRLIQDTISKVLTTDFRPKKDGELVAFESWDELTSPITDAVGKLEKLNLMGKALEEALDFSFNTENITKEFIPSIEALEQAVGIVNSLKFGTKVEATGEVTGGETGFIDEMTKQREQIGTLGTESFAAESFEEQIDDATKKVGLMNALITDIQNVPQIKFTDFQDKVTAVKQCLGELQKFVTDKENQDNAATITSSAEVFTTLAGKLEDLIPRFTQFGKDFATEIMAQYNADKPVETIGSEFTTLINTTLKNLISEFESVGTAYKDGLTKGLIEAIKNISKEMDTVINDLGKSDSSTMTKFRDAGIALGNSLVNGIKDAVEGLSVSVSMTATSNGPTPSNNSNGSSYAGGRPLNLATGGIVESGYAKGLASIFKRKGTDTVPAMLTPGEFVQRRSAVSTFGIDFMKRVNNLDVQGAFRTMTSRFSVQGLTPAVSTVVNNINHTTNNANRVTQNVNGGNADYILKRASRFLR